MTFKTFKLLMWKSYRLRQYHWVTSLMEFSLPVLLSFFLLNFLASGKRYAQRRPRIYGTIDERDLEIRLLNTQVFYTPSNEMTDRIMQHADQLWKPNGSKGMKAVNEEEMMVLLQRDVMALGVVFQIVNSFREGSTLLRYHIRNNRIWRTAQLYDPPMTINSPPPNEYVDYGLITLQIAVNSGFLYVMTGYQSRTFRTQLVLQPFPYPEYTSYDRSNDAGTFSPEKILDIITYIVLLTVIVVSIFLINDVIEEKESGVKEMLKLNGVEEWLIWIGWFLNAFIVPAVALTIVAIMLKYPFHGANSENLHFVTFPVIWLVLILYCTANISYCFMFCAIFRQAAVASSVFIVTFVVVVFSILYLEGQSYGYVTKLSCIFPVGAFVNGFKKIRYFEALGVRFNWLSVSFVGDDKLDVSLSFVFMMLLFDTFFYALLAFYITVINPGKFGVGKSPYFVFESVFFPFEDESHGGTKVNLDRKFFEEPSSNLETTIRIKNLAKNYDSTQAIRRVDLNIYKGEISAILGHNGAGKTSFISILTGLTAPTAGSIHYENVDIFKDMKTFRQHFGLCPQENRVMPYLTVEDHLWFFGMLKNYSNERIILDTNYYLDVLEMGEEKGTPAALLSTGTKRKLCLVIALLGNPDVLILDEPTSGVDVQTRRKIWNLILALRRDHSVILTTHFMEEADALGDRIAIMHQGVIVCHGTPTFLKKAYGTGYELNITKAFDDTRDLTRSIARKLPSAVLEYETVEQIVYRLPLTDTASFPKFFAYLEARKSRFGILAMGVTCTTMEQVFLRVGGVMDYKSVKFTRGKNSAVEFFMGYRKISDHTLLLFQQMLVLLHKKYLYTKRGIFSFFSRIVLPSLVLLLILRALIGDAVISGEPELQLSLKTYPATKVLIVSNAPIKSDLYRDIMEYVQDESAFFVNLTDTDVIKVLLEAGRKDIIAYNKNFMVAVELNTGEIKVLYNAIGIHSLPIAIGLIFNAWMRTINDSFEIETINSPISQSLKTCNDKETKGGFSLLWLFAMGFYTIDTITYFSGFVDMERIVGFKHIQLMSNVSSLTYWLSTIIFDLAFFFLIITARIIIFRLFDDDFYFLGFGDSFSVLILMISAYGISGLLFVYVVGFLWNTQDRWYPFTFITNLFITIVALIFYNFETLSFTLAGLKRIESSMVEIVVFYLTKYLILLIPPLNFCLLFYKFIKIWSINTSCSNCPPSLKHGCESNLTEVTYLEYGSMENPNGMLLGIQFLWVDVVLYTVLLALITLGYIPHWFNEWKKLIYGVDSTTFDDGDSDVAAERERVQTLFNDSSAFGNMSLLANGLRKNYINWFQPVTAVSNASFLVDQGECFGILGLHNAGKTTTFKMLSAEILPTFGDVAIDGVSLSSDRKQYLSLIGYCPQRNDLINELTGREMLALIAALRGVVRKDVVTLVDRWISIIGLTPYQNQLCGNYSGGNKRKLCTALSMIGNPRVIFLDEPTSGVDSYSKRRIYEVIGESQRNGQSIVLSSHSMEECETVCDRVTIMTGGVMRCIGSTQYLTRKYARGFAAIIKLRHEVDSYAETEYLKSDMMYVFSPEYCILKEEFGGLLHYQITDFSLPWSILFERMEYINAIHQAVMEEYVLRDTTLEEAFLSLVQQDSLQLLDDY